MDNIIPITKSKHIISVVSVAVYRLMFHLLKINTPTKSLHINQVAYSCLSGWFVFRIKVRSRHVITIKILKCLSELEELVTTMCQLVIF